MERMRIAIIGMGKMGKIRYDSYQRHGGFTIVSLCDLNPDNMCGYSQPKFSDWKECIDRSDIDAVAVCTFNAFIPGVVCYALEKGLHVFSEKPPGRTLGDALRMQQAQEKYAKTLKFGFNHRYHNSVIEAKALIDSGLLGDVVCARGVYGKAGNPKFGQEWRNDESLSGGGILLDQGIHMLDLLLYLIGPFERVQGTVNHLVWKEIGTEDSAFAILENAKGQVASLHSSAVQWKHKFDLDLICTNGYIALNGLLTATQSYGEETISYYRKDLSAKTGRLGKPLEHTMRFDSDSSWVLEAQEFYDVVMLKKPLQQGTAAHAVAVMQLIEKIYLETDRKTNSGRGCIDEREI